MAWASLAKATKKMKKRNYSKVHKGLLRKYEGPFLIEKHIEKLAYRVKLPLEVHLVFHVSLLKPHHDDEEDPYRNKSKKASTTITTTLEREMEEILAH
ncbi:hypothetical protein GH714_025583 [Hevea brasiliensis]|uniref:Tf2-1-like SH3-like domain-containing protein n=1 Tax=Hevea brasiliensis TaxID=3981 RepID=A0A6A6K9P9_HEVBR|nr:hypothetical protein GH714_031705 [Hevea brasiliensis]KAF2284874.1 hypothetical protein GH714_031718 [Hevea brasiliensis]KAF2289065.1 hypothetical protein GH714_025583 [Hevea brasiliensis]